MQAIIDMVKEGKKIRSKHPLNVELKCQRCGWKWVYTGRNPFYVTCPYCKTKVTVYRKDPFTDLEKEKWKQERKKTK